MKSYGAAKTKFYSSINNTTLLGWRKNSLKKEKRRDDE